MTKRLFSAAYDIHIVSNAAQSNRSHKYLENKYSELLVQSVPKYEARTLTDQRSFIVFHDAAMFEAETGSYRKGVLLKDIGSSWGTLMVLAAFVDEFCNEETAKQMVIRIGENDLDGFRLASFIMSYCIRSKKECMVKSFDDREILQLYDPPINDSTLHVLLSLVDYTLKHNNEPPTFDQLKSHHFKSLAGERVEGEDASWGGENDSRYVASLYASLRVLKKLSLVKKNFHETRRKMLGIKPTTNGYLTVLFSGFYKKLKTSLSIEEPAEEPMLDSDEL